MKFNVTYCTLTWSARCSLTQPPGSPSPPSSPSRQARATLHHKETSSIIIIWLSVCDSWWSLIAEGIYWGVGWYVSHVQNSVITILKVIFIDLPPFKGLVSRDEYLFKVLKESLMLHSESRVQLLKLLRKPPVSPKIIPKAAWIWTLEKIYHKWERESRNTILMFFSEQFF